MDNNREHKKEYHELINFAIQGMSEECSVFHHNSGRSFWNLAIFVSINDHYDLDMSKNALWMKPLSIKMIGIVL
jgi:hypothetical protein